MREKSVVSSPTAEPVFVPIRPRRTLTLVFSAKGVLCGDTPADRDLAWELVGAQPVVRPWSIQSLIQAAADHKVKLVIRTDLPPIE